MRVFRNSITVTVAVVILLALFGMVFGGTKAAAVGAKTDVVKYAPVTAGAYNLDPAHTIIGFGVKHLEIAIVKGRFKDFNGTIQYNTADPKKSTVEFSAKIDSIDTGVEPRDAHLQTADFFDAEKFPTMTFKSKHVEKKDKGYVLHGDLTIKGVTKPVSLPFTMTGAVKDPWGGTRFGISASTKIDRRDFGITWGNALPLGGVDVANEVTIELQAEAVRAAAKKAE
jgi:polyisoprenoid-binding protein YceI